MDWYSLTKQAQLRTISKQEALDRKMFGPVYHGTGQNTLGKINEEGFKVFENDARQGETSHGYQISDYWAGIPAPVHHLGFGVYFTTVKNIAKDFAGGTAKGMPEFYLDVHNIETINFGAPKTMMQYWIKNGYDPELAKKDRVAATRLLTQTLASKWEAVYFKGKGLRRLLDGDQICVYDPNKVYKIDKTLSKPGDVGSKVKRKEDGMMGILLGKRPKQPMMSWAKPETNFILNVKWKVGGTDWNVQDADVDFI